MKTLQKKNAKNNNCEIKSLFCHRWNDWKCRGRGRLRGEEKVQKPLTLRWSAFLFLEAIIGSARFHLLNKRLSLTSSSHYPPRAKKTRLSQNPFNPVVAHFLNLIPKCPEKDINKKGVM